MVLNILKKKKRDCDVQLLSNFGQFKQNNSSCEISKTNQKDLNDNSALTWDTLKRNRRKHREFSRAIETNNVAKKQFEKYRSSPDLFTTSYEPKNERKKVKPKASNHKDLSNTGSLITLNFSMDNNKIIKETAYEDTELEINYESLAHDDSGYYCDSDSGVSSLYDTISTLYSNITNHDHDIEIKEVEKCSQILNKSFLQNLDSSLLHILTRDYTRTVTSAEFSVKLVISSQVFSSPKMFLDCCCKKHLARLVIARQKELNNDSLLLSEDLKIIDRKLANLEEELRFAVNNSELKIFRRAIDQISTIVNLVFGLEIGMSEGRYNSRRLSEATSIKERHDASLHKTGLIVRDKLGVSRMILFRSLVKNKQKTVCTIKCFKTELYYVQTLMNLLNIL